MPNLLRSAFEQNQDFVKHEEGLRHVLVLELCLVRDFAPDSAMSSCTSGMWKSSYMLTNSFWRESISGLAC